MSYRNILLVTGAFMALFATSAVAEVNPDDPTETSSEGSSEINVTIPVLYKISGIADLTTASYVGNGNLSMNDPVCIYTNSAAGRTYRMTLQGSTTCTGGDCPVDDTDVFAIANDTNDQAINYQAYWNDESTTTNRVSVGTPGGAAATTANQSDASTSVTCSGGNNANFSVDFTEADLLAVESGLYEGTLTLTLIAPT
jgi:hypothetical protein